MFDVSANLDHNVLGEIMRNYIGLIVGLAVFAGWLSIVGNPHVVETVIGLVLGVGSGLWIHFKVRRSKKATK